MKKQKNDNKKSKVTYNVKSIFNEEYVRLTEEEKKENFNKKLFRCILNFEKSKNINCK